MVSHCETCQEPKYDNVKTRRLHKSHLLCKCSKCYIQTQTIHAQNSSLTTGYQMLYVNATKPPPPPFSILINPLNPQHPPTPNTPIILQHNLHRPRFLPLGLQPLQITKPTPHIVIQPVEQHRQRARLP